MINILFSAGDKHWSQYQAPLIQALDATGLTYVIATEFTPDAVDYIIYAPSSELQDFTPYTRCKAVLNLWAGVEQVVGNTTLTMPFARMVGGGLTEGMVEWVTGHVLRHHLGMDAHIVNPDLNWAPDVPPPASSRKIAILGLGTLGTACGQMLNQLGFDVHGWARRPKEVAGITAHHGNDGLTDTLRGAHFVVLLLPATPSTVCVLDADRLALLAKGSFVINPGRGPLIDDDALLSALDNGQLAHATLDVFRTEPLPKDSPYWSHPNVTVTPHIASETRADKAAEVIAENVLRGETGKPFLHLVDRDAGY